MIVEGRINDTSFLVKGEHQSPFFTKNILWGFIILFILDILFWLWIFKNKFQQYIQLIDDNKKNIKLDYKNSTFYIELPV